jgi:hypothetical protein
MHYSQPDYIFARKRDVRRFWNVGFRWPQYHDSDHQAVIGTICTGRRQLKEYRRKRQEFPLHLPPIEQQDKMTQAFEKMKVACEEPETTKAHWCDWMSNSTWLLIKQRTSLRRAGQLCRLEGQSAEERPCSAYGPGQQINHRQPCRGECARGVPTPERVVPGSL